MLYYAATIFVSIGFGSDAAAMVATVGLGVAKVKTSRKYNIIMPIKRWMKHRTVDPLYFMKCH